MRKSVAAIVGAICVAMSGCKEINNHDSVQDVVSKSGTTWVVTIGMENSKFAGACPGAGLDAKRMTELLSAYSDHVVALSNETATKANVVKAMTDAARNAGLFIFFYSGHGGQQRFWDTGSEETDGQDEFLCLYDTYMRDNEIWSIFCQSKGRIVMLNDCCHSRTMFREAKPITLKSAAPLSVTYTENGPINLQVWSGCPDDAYSYGSESGGKMTNTLLKYFDPRKTYDVLWGEIEADSDLKRYEKVQRTIIGSGFTARPVFM